MYRLGIDLGGTNIACGVVDDEYNIIGRSNLKTANERNADEIVKDMVEAAKLSVRDAGLELKDIAYCGVGIPGWVNKQTGFVVHTVNVKFSGFPLVSVMEKMTGIKTGIENDANAAAFGEYIAGAGKGTKDFGAITLGTGVGGGVIIDGKIYSGFNSAAAEIGHTVIKYDGETCSCGRRGCFESYASVTALIRQTREAMEKHPDSIMWELSGGKLANVNGRTSFDAMRKGDAYARAVIEQYVEYVAIGVTNTINTFQPEILCIGGGISREGDYLIYPLSKKYDNNGFSGNTEKQTIIKAAVLGNDAGIIGAAFTEDIH